MRAAAYRAVVAFVVTVVLSMGAWGLLPRLWGWQPMIVTSGSMSPLIQPGDVVLVAPAPGHPLAPGRVVTYRGGSGLVTHRVVDVAPDGSYVTQGDAVPQPDAQPVSRGRIVGEVRLLVPSLGVPALAARDNPLAAAAVGATIVLLLGLAVAGRRRASGRAVSTSRDSTGRDSTGPRTTGRRASGRARRRPHAARHAAAVSVGVLALGAAATGHTEARWSATTVNLSHSYASKAAFYPVAVSAAGPVAYWRLGEKTGTTGADQTGTAPLTYSTGVTLARPGGLPGDADTSVRLNSASQYAIAANVPALSMTGSYTIAAWVRAGAYPQAGNARVVARYDGSIVNYLLAWDSAGTSMRLVSENTGGARFTASATVPNDGAWHFHVGTFDGSSLRLYRDGAQVSSTPFTGTLRTTAAQTTIGYLSQAMVGDIDEVAIFNRTLSAVEIAQLYTVATT